MRPCKGKLHNTLLIHNYCGIEKSTTCSSSPIRQHQVPPPTFPKDVLVLLLRWVTEQLRHDKMEVVLHDGKKTGRYTQCRRDAYIQFCREEKFAAKYNVCTYRELRCTAVCIWKECVPTPWRLLRCVEEVNDRRIAEWWYCKSRGEVGRVCWWLTSMCTFSSSVAYNCLVMATAFARH